MKIYLWYNVIRFNTDLEKDKFKKTNSTTQVIRIRNELFYQTIYQTILRLQSIFNLYIYI